MANVTKQMIVEAFIALLEQKSVDKITVKDVVEVCGITRQTFYYHFKDLPEVIEWLMAQYSEALIDRSLAAHSPQEAMRILVGSLETYKLPLDHLLHSRRREEIERAFLAAVRTCLETLVRQSPVSNVLSINDMETALTFYSWAIVGVLAENHVKPHKDLDELADQLCRLIGGKMLLTSAKEPFSTP